MYKKLSFIFIFILILMCLFCIRSYASTDYSVYDEASGQYHIVFPDVMKEELGLPSADVPYYFSSENLYYMLIKTPEGHYHFIYHDKNFIESASDNDDFDGTYSFKRSDSNSRFKHFRMLAGTSTWADGSSYGSGTYLVTDLSSILVSSDDVYNNVSGELIVSKTVYTEDSGTTEDSVTSGSSGVTIVSNTYNKIFIDDHMAVVQSPFGAFKKIIDYYNKNYPGVFSFTSDDLPQYGLLIKGTGSDTLDSEDYDKYLFLFSSVPLTSDVTSAWASVWDFYPLEGSQYVVCCLNDYGMTFNSSSIIISDGSRYRVNLGFYGNYLKELIASNYDVMSNDGTNLVFQQPTLLKVTTLAPVVNKVEMHPVLTVIIVILPMIIMALVGLIGLRKALETLFQVFRRS